MLSIAPARRAIVFVAAATAANLSAAGCTAGSDDATSTQSSALGAGGAFDSFDESGVLRTVDVNGPIDEGNEFFQSLGTNGRSCATCHVAQDGWALTPEHVRDRFEDTDGLDPLFRTVDGSTSPAAPTATREQRRDAYRLLLRRAVFRVGLPIPAGAEFDLTRVDDPYHFASAAELSLFRRPLPTTNLAFLTTVMWDGRETFPPQPIAFDLSDRANAAARAHEQAAVDLTAAQRASIVAFEAGLFTAQVFDLAAADLPAQGATGGPEALPTLPFSAGASGPFTLYSAWSQLPEPPHHSGDRREDAREAVARGEKLFNELPIEIRDVRGLNDDLGQRVVHGHCTTCHDSPNVGTRSVFALMDIGVAAGGRRTPDMPLYTLRNKTTGDLERTTDPGRALVTGQWKDVGRFKVPGLRGLAARAPYFHDGSADDMEDVVDFYSRRFDLDLSERDQRDLVAFLRSL
jgi:hypothetical protein